MKQLIICLAVFLSANVAMAQGFRDRGGPLAERVEAQRVAFITQKLELTVDESAEFWPMYNEFKAKQKEMREEIRPDKFPRQMSETEAEEFLQSHLDMEEDMVALKRTYFERLKEVVGARKVVQLTHIESEFNRQILDALRERRKNRE